VLFRTGVVFLASVGHIEMNAMKVGLDVLIYVVEQNSDSKAKAHLSSCYESVLCIL
jgi:uncharacterized ferritin-like protein (DUF455 family)